MDICKENVYHLLSNLSLNTRFNEVTEYSHLSFCNQEFSGLYFRKHNYIHAEWASYRQSKFLIWLLVLCFIVRLFAPNCKC